MQLIHGFYQFNQTFAHTVLTIGNFDGVHLGHQAIVRQAIERARARSGTAMGYTFRPHPQVALRPGANVQLLSTYDEKLSLLEGLGVDVVIEEPFSREFSTIAPEQFFSEVILRKVSAEAIVVGYDFAFGKERSGHLAVLESFCKRSGIELTVVPPQRVGSDVVSSSKIRQYLLSGDVGAARNLLGRDFFYRGSVIKGDARGRTIGFPTANLRPENKLLLPYGVYATRTWVAPLKREFSSVTNVGVRPTFRDSVQGSGSELAALVETHVLDESIDLYGSSIDVRFVERIREERRFAGIEELKAQIAADVASARRILKI